MYLKRYQRRQFQMYLFYLKFFLYILWCLIRLILTVSNTCLLVHKKFEEIGVDVHYFFLFNFILMYFLFLEDVLFF